MNRRTFFGLASVVPVAAVETVSLIPEGDMTERIAHWACDLNVWKWPEDWGEPPEWIVRKFTHRGRTRYEYEQIRYHEICQGLRAIVGGREMLRVHNVVRRKAMTEAEFDDWYKEWTT